MRQCEFCRTPLPQGAAFCPSCGNPVPKQAEPCAIPAAGNSGGKNGRLPWLLLSCVVVALLLGAVAAIVILISGKQSPRKSTGRQAGGEEEMISGEISEQSLLGTWKSGATELSFREDGTYTGSSRGFPLHGDWSFRDGTVSCRLIDETAKDSGADTFEYRVEAEVVLLAGKELYLRVDGDLIRGGMQMVFHKDGSKGGRVLAEEEKPLAATWTKAADGDFSVKLIFREDGTLAFFPGGSDRVGQEGVWAYHAGTLYGSLTPESEESVLAAGWYEATVQKLTDSELDLTLNGVSYSFQRQD